MATAARYGPSIVDDEVEGIWRFFNSDRVEPTNVGNPIEFTIRELAEVALEETGSSPDLRSLPLPADDPQVRRPDITLAREILGWEPKIQLREGATRLWPIPRPGTPTARRNSRPSPVVHQERESA
jgi:nucleoside-diphosphate-sugar epimerase